LSPDSHNVLSGRWASHLQRTKYCLAASLRRPQQDNKKFWMYLVPASLTSSQQRVPFVDKSIMFAKQILWKSESQKQPTGKLIIFYLHEKRQKKVARVHKTKKENKTKH